MARVLVTGGAGWLGSAVTRRLAARGDEVLVLDNLQAGTPANLVGLGANVRLMSGDVTDLSVGPGPLRFTEQIVAPKKGALDVSRARTTLGYRPKYDLRRGLAAYIEWYRSRSPAPGS